jgi:hypothetical protein
VDPATVQKGHLPEWFDAEPLWTPAPLIFHSEPF